MLKANRYAAAHPTGPMNETLKSRVSRRRAITRRSRQQFVADRCNGYLAVPGARVLDDDELARVLACPAGDVAVDATQGVAGLDMGANLSMTGLALFSPTSRRIDLFAVAPPGLTVPGAVPSRGAVALPAEALALLPPGPVGHGHRRHVPVRRSRGGSRGARRSARGCDPPFRSGDVGAEIAALRMLVLDLGWAIGAGRALFAHALTQAEIVDGRIRKADAGLDDVLRAAMIGARYVVDQAVTPRAAVPPDPALRRHGPPAVAPPPRVDLIVASLAHN